jgi:hypothetical protein
VSEGRLDGQPGVVVAFASPSPQRANRPEPCGHLRYRARSAAANPLLLRGKGIPMPGELLQYEIEDLATNAPALLVVGVEPTHAGVFGLGVLLVQPLFALSTVAGADGEARFDLPLPDIPEARDGTLYVQGVADPGTGLRLSNGIVSRTAW